MADPSGRRRIASGSPYEPVVGFSRALRVGGRVLVSGTAPIWPDGSCDPDPEVQAARCLEIILAALAEAGAGPEHVVRTRMYLVDPGDWEAVGRAHGAVFAEVRPAATMVVVAALLDPRWRVEIEAEAVVMARPEVTLAVLVELDDTAVQPFDAYERQVLPLLGRHGGILERRLRTPDRRTEVHVVSFASRAGYDAYLADLDRAALRPLLDGLNVRQRLLEVTDVE